MKGKWFLTLSIIGILVVVGLSLSLYFAFKPPANIGITITDDLNRTVDINGVPQRIVSHVPSITETLFALGAGEKVVGVSDYCDYPEEARLKPSVGSYFDPSMENIVALDPDLVLTDGHSESIKPLDNMGITYLVVDPRDIDGVFRDIELLGKVTGTNKEAGKLIENMQKRISYVSARVEGVPRPKVFYVIDATEPSNPWTAGPGSFIDSLITMAGGENIGAKALSPWAIFSIEQIVSSDPEIIILSVRHGTAFTSAEVLRGHPAWQETTAVKQNRIYVIDGDLVDRTGPRIVDGLEEFARIIHPELFLERMGE
ncbi:Vitamin B12-binding protein [subsurface metagenome]